MKGEVIYIDDEPMLCRAFSAILGQRGIDAKVFTDPAAAIAYIKEARVAVIICDYRMPTLSGLEVRAHVPDQIPFYLVSGELEIQVSDDVKIAGTLTKPYRIEHLIEIVRSHLE